MKNTKETWGVVKEEKKRKKCFDWLKIVWDCLALISVEMGNLI
jgi:uncharacterized protein YbdZ (MbtH family)